MLTPRRTLLLLAGFVLFGTAYAAYAQFLGWLDGLPALPEKFQRVGGVDFVPPENQVSPTQQKLSDAFGPRAPETIDFLLYETKLEFRNGESSVVVAAGPPPSNPNSKRVTLTPFSLAMFGKPKPAHLRQPGEAVEITTVHSDKAVLEFDRVITNPTDMRAAKLVRLELVSEAAELDPDPRRGTVHIINNQKFTDPNRAMVIRTPGPVFYRDPKAVVGTPAAQGADLWTDAPVEIVDRQNLPRAIGNPVPATAATNREDARTQAVVADILAARRAPPPTVTAVGLRVYLEPETPPGAPKPKKQGGMHGLRKLDLLEQVVVNLWVDNGQSMVGGSSDGPKSGLALVPPPRELAALGGNMATAAYAARLQNRALLQIDTRGPFSYDADKNLARFDVVPHSDPKLPNDVQVTKVPAKGGSSSLFSQVLELELNGGATAAARPANAPAIKRLHAWTYTAGRFLTVASQDELMEAYGQDLVHEQAAARTTLVGAPLYVVRERNVLSAGAPQRAATLISEPGPVPGSKSQITVRGAGRVELFDAASNASTVSAIWQTSLVQTREVVNGRDQDLFTFTDAAKFEDVKADYWLKGDVLKLWLEPRGANAAAAPAKPVVAPAAPAGARPPAERTAAAGDGATKPSRIQAVGNVTSHSAEYDVEQTTQLNVYFADGKPAPAVAAAPVPPVPPTGPPAAPAVAGPPAPKPMGAAAVPAAPATTVAIAPKVEPKIEPPKPKPPTKIRANTVDTWVTRVAQVSPPTPAPKDGKGPAPPQAAKDEEKGTKYQLDRARCEGDVVVHQDPTDPTKPRGVDILGRLLIIDGAPEGSKLTVYGGPNRPGEVHQEEMSLLGPEVVLDQVHNAASVVGRGALTMPTNSDLSGTELKQPEVVVIHWRDKMTFRGALRSAEFEGKVSARQGESWVLCHTMQVTFDRPVYFNQAQKRAAPPGDKPKLDIVRCYPAAADSADTREELYVYYNQVEFDASGKMAKSQQLTAQVLEMFAQFQDPDKGGEKYQLVKAEGPGRVRVWQAGDKDPSTAPGAAPAQKGPVAPPPKGPPAPKGGEQEQEMKLTQIDFRGNMRAIDMAKRFQKATFKTSVEVFSIPADSPSVTIERHRLPPRAMMLTCADELAVVTHKQPNAAVAKQRMDATGNAYLRSDEYDGYGETISHDDKRVTLVGTDAIPARIMRRGGGDEQAGRRIVYDRATGNYQVLESTGGTIGGSKR